MKAHRFHAWRRMRDLGPEWTLRFSDHLPDDVYGFTDWADQSITLSSRLNFEERRCTIVHETLHVARGPASCCSVVDDELEVDQEAALLLIPHVPELIDALVWHGGRYDNAAEELWVDVWTLEVRLATLDYAERVYLNERMDEVALER